MNNYKFINYDWYRNMPKHTYYNIAPNMIRNDNYLYPEFDLNNNQSTDLFAPGEGFKNGNLFDNIKTLFLKIVLS